MEGGKHETSSSRAHGHLEDPDRADTYHWVLLETTGHEIDQLRKSAASNEGYGTAQAAFDAGALRWREEIASEDEDADPVGDGGIEPE